MLPFQVSKGVEETFERYTEVKDEYGGERDEFENKRRLEIT